jgi:hypothetical protein
MLNFYAYSQEILTEHFQIIIQIYAMFISAIVCLVEIG